MRARRTSIGHRYGARRLLILAAAATATLAAGSADAQAAPEYPIPADAKPAPPPIPPVLPAAGETPPPADAIGDPITPDATCGDWHPQGDYGGRWPAGSMWWEYECTLALVIYPECSGTGQCSTGYWEIGSSTDRFYWDGSGAVFYGQNSQFGCEHWWDEPTRQWYILESPGCEAPAPNDPPTAAFTSDCSGHTCSFNASASTDSDGPIAAYSWDFGDGSSGSGETPQHTYGDGGTYQVKLTVTDNAGATDTDVQSISVSAEALTVLAISDGVDAVIGPGSTPVTITGSGFVNDSKVFLEGGKGPTPIASGITVLDSHTIKATIAVAKQVPKGSAQWDVRVTNPDSSTSVLSGGLTVVR
jgi:PKD repeat protein